MSWGPGNTGLPQPSQYIKVPESDLPLQVGFVSNVGGGGIGSGQTIDVVVTFPTPYPAGTTPTVTVTAKAGLENGGPGQCRAYLITNPTNTGFTVRVVNDAALVQTLNVHWNAWA